MVGFSAHSLCKIHQSWSTGTGTGTTPAPHRLLLLRGRRGSALHVSDIKFKASEEVGEPGQGRLETLEEAEPSRAEIFTKVRRHRKREDKQTGLRSGPNRK